MEPILISSLLPFVQNAILNNQDKLNPDHDAYISEKEIGEILRHFGAKDISELQNGSKNPVDAETNTTGLDTFEKTTEDQAQDQEPEGDDLKENVLGKITQRAKGFHLQDSAAEEMTAQTSMDISYSNVNTPYTALYKSLIEKRAELIKKGQNVDDLDSAIYDVITNTKEYIKENARAVRENMIQDGDVTVIKIGNKPAILRRQIAIGGNNAMKDQNAANMVEEYNEKTSGDEGQDQGQDQDQDQQQNTNNNNFVGNVQIAVSLETDTTQINANINAGSDNTDAVIAGAYNKTFENDAILTGAANLRLTIEPGQNIFSAGGAVDFQKDKFTTGAYGYYNRESIAGYEPTNNSQAEAYVMYGDNLKGAIGMQNKDLVNYYYARVKAQGELNPNENLKLVGNINGEFGKYVVDRSANVDFDTTPTTNIEFSAKGGVYFKSDDLNANLNAAVRYGCFIDPTATTKEDKYQHEVSASVMGSLQKGKFGLSALVSAFHDSTANQYFKETLDMPVKISSNVTLEYKNLYPGISPRISYTLDNSLTGNQHQVQVGVGCSIEKLAELIKK